MRRDNRWLSVLGGLVIVATIFYFGFEPKKVVDTKWNEVFLLNSKAPNSFYVFHNLLKEKFGDKNVVYSNNIEKHEVKDTSHTLLISISDKVYFDKKEVDSLTEFIKNGGTYAIIANEFNLTNADYSISSNQMHTYENDKKFVKYFNGPIDSFNYIHHRAEFSDTSFFFYYDYTARFYKSPNPDTSLMETFIMKHDTNIVYSYFDLGNGRLYLHTIPQLFTNSASLQDFYLNHINGFLEELDDREITNVVFFLPTKGRPPSDQSPLKILLANKYFANAYYVLLFLLALYLLFGTKRKQKAIPILAEKQNTSLKFVDTLAKLYEYQDQPSKLVAKMEENFYNYVAYNFYLFKEDENFITHLSKKTKVNEDLIKAIINDFNTIKREQLCSNYNLITLNQNIEEFKKMSK
jgi:hypothetical protein